VSEVATETVDLRRRLARGPAAVFAAWTDPGWIARWMTPIGTATAEVDLRVGGRFRIVMAGEGQVIEHVGEYLEIDPPSRLQFTWSSPYTGPRPGLVTVTFEAAEGGTDLRLVHELLPTGASTAHAGGWGRMLERLIHVLERSEEP
jgi:uncharacterized protein YndB with AHSA1/START domain